ncbi:MAG: GNAT family N-acetyltransferase [Oscillospiraceae bacterium]|jgi:ribosomal-protein-alanine N-acetyltransferase|nr:GNAT family N-acetyltransferase [Oscillospiraceae bacterium]
MSENNVSHVFLDVETENFVLRQICINDMEEIYKQFSDCDVCRFLVDAEPFTSMEEAEDLINWYMSPEPRSHHRWVIIRKADGAFLGTCGYHNWDKNNKICEIGYDLGIAHWGKGYMTEALQAILKVGFEKMGLNRIQGFVHVQNEKSISLLLKLGFKQEGIIRDKHFFRGNFYDHYCFSLLKREWQP